MNGIATDLFNTIPSSWYENLPFYVQDDVDLAIAQFRKLSGDVNQYPADLFQARARGWLAYCYLVVHFDQWQKKDWNGDGSVDLKDIDDVRQQAGSLVASAREFSSEDYDIRWAYAYERLFCEDFAEAKTTIDSIFASQHGGSDAEQLPPGESGVYAECADMYVYLGDVEQAVARAREAVTISLVNSGSVPDWYYWTLAWALYHQAIVVSEQGTEKRRRLLLQSQNALRLMRRARTAKRFDFDALRLQAVISDELGDTWERDHCRSLYLSIVKLKKNGRVWCVADEMARSPFHGDVAIHDASTLRENWKRASAILFEQGQGSAA